MTDNKRTLSSYKVEDNDMIVLEVATTPPVTSTQASSPVPPINFSGVQVEFCDLFAYRTSWLVLLQVFINIGIII